MEKPGKGEIQPVRPAKAYYPPKITRFGKVRELTTGGTGAPEMGSSMSLVMGMG